MVDMISHVTRSQSLRFRKTGAAAVADNVPPVFAAPAPEAPVVFDNTARLSVEDTLVLADAMEEEAPAAQTPEAASPELSRRPVYN